MAAVVSGYLSRRIRAGAEGPPTSRGSRTRGHGALFLLFDKNNRRARLRPVLITLRPVALPIAASAPALPRTQWLWSLVLLSGLPLFADQLGRSRGKRIEQRLFLSWGGKPGVQVLRWRGPTGRQQLGFLHARVQEITGPSLRLPTAAEEEDPWKADQIYDAAGLALRVRARGLPGAEPVHEQNCEYGFRRNVLGLRPYALPVAVAGLLAALGLMRFPLTKPPPRCRRGRRGPVHGRRAGRRSGPRRRR
ncbi:hypothetical protein ACFZCV_08480 [Streptomyces sp. NPDC007920]|uniref:hypothetical protein n=1 Tax=Streptomyces sp. NPDC007920 TaxID=3364794 RepID=UPI0036E0C5CC